MGACHNRRACSRSFYPINRKGQHHRNVASWNRCDPSASGLAEICCRKRNGSIHFEMQTADTRCALLAVGREVSILLAEKTHYEMLTLPTRHVVLLTRDVPPTRESERGVLSRTQDPPPPLLLSIFMKRTSASDTRGPFMNLLLKLA